MRSLDVSVRFAVSTLTDENPDKETINRIVDSIENENVDITDALINEGLNVNGITRRNVSDNENVGVNDPVENTEQVREIGGLPVINEDGERLGFMNPKSSNIIHIASVEEPSDEPAAPPGMTGRAPKVYRWSECGNGSSRGKNKENAIYISEDELDDEYITRNGDVVGKICGNCRKSL